MERIALVRVKQPREAALFSARPPKLAIVQERIVAVTTRKMMRTVAALVVSEVDSMK
jgi:hypothetical protein